MDAKTSGTRLCLRDLEHDYKSELKSAIHKLRQWEERRIENDVVQLVLDKEGQALRSHVCGLIELLRDVRSWRRAGDCPDSLAAE